MRTWVTGHEAGQKGSNNQKVLDLEANGIRNYDDTILDLIDQLMVIIQTINRFLLDLLTNDVIG